MSTRRALLLVGRRLAAPDGATHGLERLDGSIGRGEDSVRARSSEGGSDTGGGETLSEKAEVVVALEVGLLLADGNAIGSPNLSRSLEASERINDVCVQDSGGTSLRSGECRNIYKYM